VLNFFHIGICKCQMTNPGYMAKTRSRKAELAAELVKQAGLKSTAELTASNKGIIDLHIAGPTMRLWVLVRVPLSSDWAALDEADHKTDDAHHKEPNGHCHDRCANPRPRSKDTDEKNGHTNFRQRDAEKGPYVGEQTPEGCGRDSLREVIRIDQASCIER